MKLNSSFVWIVKMKGNENCPLTQTNVIFMIIPGWWHCSLVCARKKAEHLLGVMLDELQWPTLETQRDQLPLLFIHKIHFGIMFIDKNKYLIPSQRTRSTRSSHNLQYCRPQTYSDALKYSFSKWLFPIGIVWLQLWSQLRPQRSSGHSFK